MSLGLYILAREGVRQSGRVNNAVVFQPLTNAKHAPY